MASYTNIPGWLTNDLREGKITNKMFNVMFWLFSRANFKTGVVRMASAKRILDEQWADDYENDRPSKRTIQEALYRLDKCGYIASHHVAGQRGSYAVTINNYSALVKGADGALTETLLNPTDTSDWRDLPKARCADKEVADCADASADAALTPRRDCAEASAYTLISAVSSLSPLTAVSGTKQPINQPTLADAPSGAELDTAEEEKASGIGSSGPRTKAKAKSPESKLAIFDDDYEVYRRGFGNGEEPLDVAGKMLWAVEALVACFDAYRRDGKPSTEELKQWYEVCKFCEDHCCFPIDLLNWASVHHTSAEERGMVPHSIAAFYNALLGPKVSPTNGLMAQYKECSLVPCRKCIRDRKAEAC